MPSSVQTAETSIPNTVFKAKNATVIGDVRLGKDSSIWYNAVLRGDINFIEVGERTNIQDGSILHLENDRACIIGNDVTIGHGALVHGCTVKDGVLVGMGAILLNGAVIGKGSIIGAGAVIKENSIIPDHSLVVGIPGKVVRTLDKKSYSDNVKWAKKYVILSKKHMNSI
ncbi:gamma carbonic anhydrase family protein [bacterium]|nr:gamma carbonic anhydrase family protein [bacterium]